MGKTEVARALAGSQGARLIRLQCHEGIDLHHAVYDWDYQRQLLAIRAAEAGAQARELFGREFLLRRPLLEALEHDGPAVLLIDEVDRADDEFEAFLLEFLADFAITIPELGTVTGRRRPLVVLTSNRTRELHDALKRRCLYHWIDYPDRAREAEIVRTRLPGVPEAIAERVCTAVARLREEELYKLPGVGETITWARALLALDGDADLDEHARRGPEGAGGHRARPRPRSARGCLSRSASASPSSPPPMRAGGAPVGVGELLGAHRALAAVDASSRGDAFFALRAVHVLDARRHGAVRPGVRGRVRRRGRRAAARDPAADRAGDRAARRRSRPGHDRRARGAPRSGGLERGGAAAGEGLRRVHGRRARDRAGAARAAGPALAAAALPAHARHGAPARAARPAGDGPRLAAPRRRAARAPLPRAGRAPAAARARVRRLGLDGAVLAHDAPVPPGERRPRAPAWRRSCSAPASPA